MLTTVEFADAAGITYRQADYWCRSGVLAPEVEAKGSGSRRRFHPDEVRIARFVAAVTFSGDVASPGRVTRAVAQVRQLTPDQWVGAAFVDGIGNVYRDMPDDLAWAVAVNLAACAAVEPARDTVAA